MRSNQNHRTPSQPPTSSSLTVSHQPVISSAGRASDRSREIRSCLSRHILSNLALTIMRGMHEGSYFTYIMASRSRTLYIGVTGNLLKRVFQHKWGEFEGFTEKYHCDRLVWFESHQNVAKAIAREKQLKRWRREKKLVLIERLNPAWVDLSKDWYDVEPADFKRATDRMLS